MARRPTTGPTEAELEILHVLWQRGPSSVREVHDALSKDAQTGRTTTLKLMQIMVDKGLLVRDDEARPHVYRPADSKERTQRTLLHDLVQRAFDSSAAQLVVRALKTQRTSAEELDEIRRLIDRIEQEGDQ